MSSSATTRQIVALLFCNLLVFLGSVCLMALELTAARLIAKSVGSSLYTWTSVIGVVLAGMTLGNYIGGWLADRFNPQRLLSWLFLSASVLCFSVLWLDQIVSDLPRPAELSWPAWIVLTVASMFFLPSAALGAISPVVASLALKTHLRPGITLGNIYAWGALGSIVGTFVTGFILIDMFGTRAIVTMTAATLAILAALVASGQRVFRVAVLAGWLQFVSLIGLIASSTGPATALIGRGMASWIVDTDEDARFARIELWSSALGDVGGALHRLGRALMLRDDDPEEYNDESSYSAIVIGHEQKTDSDEMVQYLRLDKLTHAHFSPDNPKKLYYEYEQIYAEATERASAREVRPAAVALKPFPGIRDVTGALPHWARYDVARGELAVTLTLTPDRRDELLRASPYGEFWIAMDTIALRLEQPSRARDISAPLQHLPAGTDLPAGEPAAIRFDPARQALIASRADYTRNMHNAILLSVPQRAYYDAVQELFAQSRAARALFIGGGGFVFPRWFEWQFGNRSAIDVAEIDPAVKLAVHRAMGYPRDADTIIRTYLADARNVVDDLLRKPATSGQSVPRYDFIYGDAFNDFSVPWHLVTLEFTRKIRQLLADDGVYLVNLIDRFPRTVSSEPLARRYEKSLGNLIDRPVGSDWLPLREPYSMVETRDDDDALRLSVRGAMSPGLREGLLQILPGDPALTATVNDLYVRSRVPSTGRFLGRFVRTLREVFPNIYVYSTSLARPGDERDTFVVVASALPLALGTAQTAGYWRGRPFASLKTARGNVVMNDAMRCILDLAEGKLLTDDHAPVDNLLLPVMATHN